MGAYAEEYRRSIEDPEGFWREQAREIDWYRFPETILAPDHRGFERWFPDGQLNTCYLAVDRHVERGCGEQAAILYDSPVTGARERLTYTQLQDRVTRCAGGLRALGVAKGDRVIIYMPMIPETLIAMLACARLGAPHSVVFGGFAANELAVRVDDTEPRVIISATCGLEFSRVVPYQPIVDDALEIARHQPAYTVYVERPQQPLQLTTKGQLHWRDLITMGEPAAPEPVLATHPLYILYTSGTTGKPKGVVRDHGGHAVAMNYSMGAIYGADPGETFWTASDVGWVVGHSYIVYGPLIRGCTSVLFEGKPVKTPDAGAFWRVIEDYGVRHFFTAPTAFRSIKKEDPDAALAHDYDLSSLEHVFVAGERLDPPTYEWLAEHLPCPVIDHWWQTETGWAIAGNPVGIERLPIKPGSATVPSPGYELRVLDDAGDELPPGESGNLVVRLPTPPGNFPTLWNDDARFHESYLAPFDGYYLSADGGMIDEDGYVFVMGRTDDVINVAGHRLSTGAMEEVLGAHPAIAECAVVGIDDAVKGQLPVGFVVLKDGVEVALETLQQELAERVRAEIGAIAAFRQVVIVERLPKTRSGKILRKTMRRVTVEDEVPVPPTIDDPAIMQEIRTHARSVGIGP